MESKIVDPLQITFEVSVAADKRSRDLLHNPVPACVGTNVGGKMSSSVPRPIAFLLLAVPLAAQPKIEFEGTTSSPTVCR
jgi:hypothetical protein